MSPASVSTLKRKITACNACPRLRSHCLEIAQVKRKAYLQDTYWAKPISGFGDPQGRLMIVGLAPAAHGANRTGRIFTGDRSGEWLFRALHQAGLANQPNSDHRDDDLELRDAYITCVVKCAPPDNKPFPNEIKQCGTYLQAELKAMPQVRVYLALGQIALNSLWPHLHDAFNCQKLRPPFSHGGKVQLSQGHWLLMSYHPSQQNTFTGRLTEPMFDSVFSEAKKLLSIERR